MIYPEKLKNGLNAVVFPVENTEAITVLILVKAGSRYETPSERGISHFLEHMFFKGGEKYKNAQAVAEAIDSVGGDFNAFTGKEYTGYYVKLAKDSMDTAFSVLGDMMCNAKLEQSEIERERGVILEEYNLYQDTPIYQIGWDFERLLFGNQPLGWDQIGTKENIRSFSRDNFSQFRNELYTPENTLVVLTGNISHDEGMQKIEKYFPLEKRGNGREITPHIPSNQNTLLSLKDKKTEQGHLVLGYPGVSFASDDEYSSRLLSIALGGNMSSRMFREIREKKGLCYSISTSTDQFSDAGVFSTHAGVDLSRFKEAIGAIKGEYEKVAENGISEAELVHAKNFIKGKITLKLEDSEEIASFLGSQIILKGKAKKVKTLFSEIDEIALSDVNALAKRLFVPDKIALAAIGPFGEMEEELRELLKK